MERWLSPLPPPSTLPIRHDLPPPTPSPMDLSESRINAQADARVHQIFEGPAPPTATVEELDIPDAEDDEADQYDPSMDSAFAHLLQVIDQPTSTGTPSPPLTTELYSALSNLSHTHPWSSLTFDLKALLPNNVLYTLAKTITDILAPPNSDIPLPDVHPVFFTQDFWHTHLVYASDLASPEGVQASAIDTLAGDQLCQWSVQGVDTQSLLSASHLTVFLPPRVGAYLLANHSSHASLLSTSNQDRTHFVVRQNALFHCPQIIPNPYGALHTARTTAITGRLATYILPHLADPGPAAIQKKLTWTLRFPLPAASSTSDGGQRFANLALHSTGHRSTSALHNAIRRGTAASPLGFPFPPAQPFYASPTQLTAPVRFFVQGHSLLLMQALSHGSKPVHPE